MRAFRSGALRSTTAAFTTLAFVLGQTSVAFARPLAESENVSAERGAPAPAAPDDDAASESERAPEAPVAERTVRANATEVRAADPAIRASAAAADHATTMAATLPVQPKEAVPAQAISVPKGQGTVQGLGESFSTQASTGTFTTQVPILLPTGRGAARPQLALSYSSASGGTNAGLGWSLGVPFIARQTDRGIPRYQDPPSSGFDPDQDHFVYGGGAELVPVCAVHSLRCDRLPDETMPAWAEGWLYFRSRVESAYLRFFWSPDRRTWRVQDKSGANLELGVPLDGSNDENALEHAPDAPARIFQWNLARQYDAQGVPSPLGQAEPHPANPVLYRYTTEGNTSYLTDIYDTPPLAGASSSPLSAFAHHTRIVYEGRSDTGFSFHRGYRATLDRRIARIDITSKGESAAAARELVRRYHLRYAAHSRTSLLESVTLEGRCRTRVTEDSAFALPTGTGCPTMPPTSFRYTSVRDANATAIDVDDLGSFSDIAHVATGAPAIGLQTAGLDFMDLDGDGLTDLVRTTPSSAAPHHALYRNGASGQAAAFGALQQLTMPSTSPIGAELLSFGLAPVVPLDLDGDARVDLAYLPRGAQARLFTPKKQGANWQWSFRDIRMPMDGATPIDMTAARGNVRVMDVNADGLVDLVMTTGSKIRSYLALGRYPGGDGRFGTARLTSATTATLSDRPLESCAPGDDVQVQLGSPDIQVADMNGDGLVDLVRLQSGSVDYWPGRGDGSWGNLPPLACEPRRAPGERAEVHMTNAPSFTTNAVEVVRLSDANGDGLDDIVHIAGKQITVFFNLGGAGFSTAFLRVTPAAAIAAQPREMRLVDIDGSGSTDVVWGSDAGYRYLDLLDGIHPNLLSEIKNGLGRSTSIEYASSTSLMLEAERAGAPWSSKMPVPVHVVRRVTEADGLAVAGRPPFRMTTEYAYRDPVYDHRQREFRGFREATARALGDASRADAIARTVFMTGDCVDETPADGVADCAPEGRYRDNGREALKGLPVLRETFDGAGTYLSTSHSTYTLRHLVTGLDGRSVRSAFESTEDNWLYDTSPFTPSPQTIDLDDVAFDGAPPTTMRTSVPLRASAGRVRTRSARELDKSGNLSAEIGSGCIEGCAELDEVIAKRADVRLVAGDVSGWLWRPVQTWIEGNRTAGRRHEAFSEYDDRGNVVVARATLAGTLPLDRSHEIAGAAIAPTPPSASRDGALVTLGREYDAAGNTVFERVPGNQCRRVVYDADYASFPVAEITYAGAVDQNAGDGASRATAAFAETRAGAGCGSIPLMTTAIYDRPLGLPTDITQAHGERARVVYDGFGRVAELYAPDPDRLGWASPLASIHIDYDVDATGARAFSVVHTRAQDGATASDPSTVESWAYLDGLGRTIVTLSQADPAAGDPAAWIATGLTEYDRRNSPARVFQPWFSSADPAAFPIAEAPTTPFTTHQYDAFGRETRTLDLQGNAALEKRYHALGVDLWDAADLRSQDHAGTYASSMQDGHGRDIGAVERIRDHGALVAIRTSVRYLASGEKIAFTRSKDDGAAVTRWARYDTLGRLVLNVEPSTTRGFVASDPGALPSTLKAWRYAYDDTGAIVGTSDARGCGTSLYYDASGRVIGEDDSPCRAQQIPYSPIDRATGAGFEVEYRYDVADARAPSELPASAALTGRLVSVATPANETFFQYDAAGRVVAAATRIAKPDGAGLARADRYAPRVYVERTTFDVAARPLASSTGADVPELRASNGESKVYIDYTKRGTVQRVRSSYGTLVAGVKRDADGQVTDIAFGDGAGTRTSTTFDDLRRIKTVQTFRGPPALWSKATASYSPVTAATGQLLLEDLEYGYDEVANPIAIADHRSADEWPAGAKPVSRRMAYDDLNRVARVDYDVVGDDTWVSPFDAEDRGDAAGARPVPSPHVSFDRRVRWQSFAYDWLGNSVATDDDAHGFYDRSLGTIHNGESGASPYQLTSAANRTTDHARTREGNAGARYDEAGNLVDLVVKRDGPCLPAGASCAQRFAYDWDERGRLAHARRWDVATPGDVGTAFPDGAPSAELRFAYDQNDRRVRKTARDAAGAERHAVYVSASLELRSARWIDGDYERTAATESVYLFAHGARVAHVAYAKTDVPSLASGRQRVFLELPDHLGSSATVLDLETGELVEKSTYQVYGAADSDYRPARWDSYRDDYRFTGKEDDVEVGLQYFGKRYYAPQLGRWISADPMTVHQFGADMNAYAYVRGSVLKAIDPNGLEDINPHPVVDWAEGTGPSGPGGGHVTMEVTVPKGEGQEAVKKQFSSIEDLVSYARQTQHAQIRVYDNAAHGDVQHLLDLLGPSGRSVSSTESTLSKVDKILHPESEGTNPTPMPGSAAEGKCLSNCWDLGAWAPLISISSRVLDAVELILGAGALVKAGASSATTALASEAMEAAVVTEAATETAEAAAPKLLPQFTPSTVDEVIESSARLRPGGQISEGARGIAKKLGHAQKGGYTTAFEGLKASQAEAEGVIRGIMENPVRTVIGDSRIDVYGANGVGVRFDRATNEFIGFLEASLATR